MRVSLCAGEHVGNHAPPVLCSTGHLAAVQQLSDVGHGALASVKRAFQGADRRHKAEGTRHNDLHCLIFTASGEALGWTPGHLLIQVRGSMGKSQKTRRRSLFLFLSTALVLCCKGTAGVQKIHRRQEQRKGRHSRGALEEERMGWKEEFRAGKRGQQIKPHQIGQPRLRGECK